MVDFSYSFWKAFLPRRATEDPYLYHFRDPQNVEYFYFKEKYVTIGVGGCLIGSSHFYKLYIFFLLGTRSLTLCFRATNQTNVLGTAGAWVFMDPQQAFANLQIILTVRAWGIADGSH